jgi:hypothetical protein
MSIYALIRVGVWRVLPDWCAERTKDEWEIISFEEFEKEVGDELLRAMMLEHGYLGFSIRRVPDAISRRRR